MTITTFLCLTLAVYVQSVGAIWQETDGQLEVTQKARVAAMLLERYIERALYVGQPAGQLDHLALWSGDDDPADGKMNLNEIVVFRVEITPQGGRRLMRITHERPPAENTGFNLSEVPAILNDGSWWDVFANSGYAQRTILAEDLQDSAAGAQFGIFEESDRQAYASDAVVTYVQFRLTFELTGGVGTGHSEPLTVHGTTQATSYWRDKFEPVPPEVFVAGNGVSISDGDATPDTGDHTDFELVELGEDGPLRTFIVRNLGRQRLILSAVIVPAGFTLVEGLSAALQGGGSDRFTVRLDSDTIGTYSGQISFSTNDGDEDPFNFTIIGRVLYPEPEITVLGNGTEINDGSLNPNTGDHTRFGNVVLGGGGQTNTFTVRNDGATELTLGPVSIPTGYTLTEPLPATLAPGATATFSIRLETAVLGVKQGLVTFKTSDSDENPFNFEISGTVIK